MYTTLLLFAGMIASVLAHPSNWDKRNDTVQIVHLTFHGGPASYSMGVPADGNDYTTGSDIAVSIIDDNDFNAAVQCTFTTASQHTLVQNVDTKSGDQYIVMGPPQPITSVSCHGTCLGIYDDCYDPFSGQYVGPCCNGYCAADKCRPWSETGNDDE